MTLAPINVLPATASPANVARAAVGIAGLAWNLFGAFELAQTLMHGMSGAPPEPPWMTAAFATGVMGGLVGSALVLARRRRAIAIFAVSLVAYVVLFVGDVTEGVFAALGAPQVAILTVVVAIAAALLATSTALARRGALVRSLDT